MRCRALGTMMRSRARAEAAECRRRNEAQIDAVGPPAPSERRKTIAMNGLTRTCPKCRAPMRLRTAARGANADGQLWGCSQYPRCKATMPASGASEAVAERRRNPGSDGPRSGNEAARTRRWTDRVGVEGHETTDVAIGSRPRWLTVRRAEDERVIAKLLDLTRIQRRRRGAKAVPEMQRP